MVDSAGAVVDSSFWDSICDSFSTVRAKLVFALDKLLNDGLLDLGRAVLGGEEAIIAEIEGKFDVVKDAARK